MIRIGIVEDDPTYAEQIRKYLDTYMKETGEQLSSTVFYNGEQLLFSYEPVYDILLMDVEMPGIDGIAAARKVRQQDEEVIILFITNMAQYAISGYTVQARAYILKPINYYGFSLELSGAIAALNKRKTSSLLISGEDGLYKLRIGDITYIESQKHNLLIHTKEQGVIRIRDSMKNMEEKLGNFFFARCNVSFLVNLAYVVGISGDIVMVAGDRVPISRQKRKAFIEALSLYIGGDTNA